MITFITVFRGYSGHPINPWW